MSIRTETIPPRLGESRTRSGRRVTLAPQGHASSEDLPAYTAMPAYESVPHPENVTRRVVLQHEKRVKKDLKAAQRAEAQCVLIKKIIPDVYAQLNAACEVPRAERVRTGPAALRRDLPEEDGIEIVFKSRGIDQKALQQYLPILLADYQAQMAAQADIDIAISDANTGDLVSRSMTAPVRIRDDSPRLDTEHDMASSSTSRPELHHAATAPVVRNYDPDRLSVTAGYFESYTQKIYFSKRFASLWKKKESGRREELAAGIAMVLVGLKLGLPMFDLFTFAVLDVPRLAMQRFTGKQTLKLRD